MAGAYAGYSSNINAQVCLNLIPFIDREENEPAFIGRPGLKSETELYASNPVRGSALMGGDLWVAVGNRIYKRTTGGSNTNKGTLDTASGPVHFAAGYGDKLFFTDGTSGYTITSDTFAKITDADFPTNPTGAAYIDGWYITAKGASGDFYLSDLDNPTSWSATRYSNAEGDPDDLQIPINHNNDLWLLGATTMEIWFDSGAASFAFERITGAIANVGTGSPHSAASWNRTLFFLDNFGIVRAAKGLDPQRISTPQIEYQLQQYTTLADAIGYVVPYEGHEFYVLNFPTANASWAYDITTGLWSKWASYSTDGRFRGACYSKFNGKHLVGDHSNGKLLELDNATYQDDSNAITRTITTRKVNIDGRYLIHNNFKVGLEPGHGEIALALTWSDDAGHTWATGSTKTLANTDYDAIAKWSRLGMSKLDGRIYKLSTTSNAKIAIKAVAHGDLTVTNRR